MGQSKDHRTDADPARGSTFLRRLLRDTGANTLAISAASLVPLLAMVGGGVDASRYYMAEARLQAACDSGALAARRAMDSDSFGKEHKNIANSFFQQNFQDGIFGTEDLEHTYTATDEGEVVGTASGTMPTSVMSIFGYDKFDLSVTCTADINVANTDIVMVLDVTHSMNCPADNAGCNNSTEWSNSKLSNLRESVLAFYDTIDASTSDSAQIRYGLVPYSQQVNVGDALDASWIATSHTYQSREPEWATTTYETETFDYVRTGNASNWRYQGTAVNAYTGLTYDQCVAETATEYDIFNSSNPSTWTQVSQTDGTPPVTEYTGTVTWEYYTFKSGTYSSVTGLCTVVDYFYLYDSPAEITHYPAGSSTSEFFWAYRPVTYDLTNVKTDGSIVAPTGWAGANVTHAWNGCIEEADTVATATWSPLPSAAHDLDIDLVPTTEEEKWKPMLPTAVWQRYTDATTSFTNTAYWTQDDVISQNDKGRRTAWCPKAARKLDAFDNRDDLEDWLSADNGFVVAGNTYHDYGMVWGARFISPDGIFASENRTAPNGDAISRHIIFMTDGVQATANYDYTPHGIEWWDRRVTDDGSAAQLSDRHASRFQAACRAARNKNISVWVVAFGTSLTQNLIDCATPGRAYHAADADELENAFVEIAAQIAALRLTD